MYHELFNIGIFFPSLPHHSALNRELYQENTWRHSHIQLAAASFRQQQTCSPLQIWVKLTCLIWLFLILGPSILFRISPFFELSFGEELFRTVNQIIGVCKHPPPCMWLTISRRHIDIMTIIAIHCDSLCTNCRFLKTGLVEHIGVGQIPMTG